MPPMSRPLRSVCVFAASSRQSARHYVEAAHALGERLADAGLTLVYGGGAVGLMGAVADAVLDRRGRVVGVIPGFMRELEWAHQHLSELHVVSGMHERKRVMIERSDAFVALPGGSGTFDELFEVISWKRLGLHTKPIVVLDVAGFFEPWKLLMQRAVEERFMSREHATMWAVVERVDEVLPALYQFPEWGEDAVRRAAL